MKDQNFLKSGLWTVLLASIVGLSACQKDVNETDTVDENEAVAMSAEPAESNAPAIVASDLDEADAQSNEAAESKTIDSDTAVASANDKEIVSAEEGTIEVDDKGNVATAQ